MNELEKEIDYEAEYKRLLANNDELSNRLTTMTEKYNKLFTLFASTIDIYLENK